MTTTSPAEPEKLKPCPFCGELPIIDAPLKRPGIVTVMCNNEECRVFSEACGTTEADAASIWNTRTRDAARVELNKAGSLIQEVGMHLQGLMSITKERGELAGMCYEAAEILRAALAKDSNQ